MISARAAKTVAGRLFPPGGGRPRRRSVRLPCCASFPAVSAVVPAFNRRRLSVARSSLTPVCPVRPISAFRGAAKRRNVTAVRQPPSVTGTRIDHRSPVPGITMFTGSRRTRQCGCDCPSWFRRGAGGKATSSRSHCRGDRTNRGDRCLRGDGTGARALRWSRSSRWRAGRSTPPTRGWVKTTYQQGDILDREAVDALVARADVVIHLAFLIMGSRDESTQRQSAGLAQRVRGHGRRTAATASGLHLVGGGVRLPLRQPRAADRGRADARIRRALLLRAEGGVRGCARRHHQGFAVGRVRAAAVHRRRAPGARVGERACSGSGCPARCGPWQRRCRS